ncbi:AMP-binding, partial [Paramuricea clavata]
PFTRHCNSPSNITQCEPLSWAEGKVVFIWMILPSVDAHSKFIVFTVNEHENICIAGPNSRAGYATAWPGFSLIYGFNKSFPGEAVNQALLAAGSIHADSKLSRLDSKSGVNKKELFLLFEDRSCVDPICIINPFSTLSNVWKVISNVDSTLDKRHFARWEDHSDNIFWLTKICIPVPLYHCFGMVLGSLISIIFGATAVYPSAGFDARAALAACHNEKCTSLYGTPTMFIDMLNHEDLPKFDLTSLRTGIMGGSQCHIEIMNAVIEKMHLPEMTIAYGLTELSTICCQTQVDDPVDVRVSTVGKIISSTEGKIVNEHGEIIPVGEGGELCVRGFGVMLGYWEDEDKTESMIDASGWLHTGDKASMDENGYVKIIGRVKDMIIRGGENIYPSEIEQFLHHHPKIQEVEVIGVPDKRLGEEVCAWIRSQRLMKGETATTDEIKEFCKGKVEHVSYLKLLTLIN